MGVKFKTGVEVGKDISLDKLREQGFKAFYLAVGAFKGTKVGCPGDDMTGVFTGIDFLREIGVVRSMVKTALDIGELSLVISKYVEDIYPVVIGDTWLKDTKLVINVIPGMAECDECNELFHVIEHEGYCPNCGSFEKTILSGKDFLVREIHIPED